MMSAFLERVVRAAKLDAGLYEEVEADKSAMGQSMGIVVLSSVAAGIGFGGRGLVLGVMAALISWFVWAWLVYIIGTKMLPEPGTKSDIGELLRTLGFSSAPGVLRILGIIPVLRNLVFLITGVWMVAAMVVAVRQALDYKSTGRAVMVCLLGWFVQMVVLALLLTLAGSPGA
jgi:hypothetical protein